MRPGNEQTFGAAAMLGWVGVGVYGIWEMAGQEAGDGWQRPYLFFTVSLLVAVAGTTAVAWTAGASAARSGLRNTGAGIAAIAIASSLVAWAVPLWATLLAVACALFAVAAPLVRRPGLVMLAAAPVVGMAAMFVAIAGELGRQDSYGDYPAAFGLGTTIIAAGSVLGLAVLAGQHRTARPQPSAAPDRGASAAI